MQTLRLSPTPHEELHPLTLPRVSWKMEEMLFLFILFLFHSGPTSSLLCSWCHVHLSPFGLWAIKYLLFLLPSQLLCKFFSIRCQLSSISPTSRGEMKHPSTLSSYLSFFFSQNISQRVNILCLHFLISHSSFPFLPSYLPISRLFCVLLWWASMWHSR